MSRSVSTTGLIPPHLPDASTIRSRSNHMFSIPGAVIVPPPAHRRLSRQRLTHVGSAGRIDKADGRSRPEQRSPKSIAQTSTTSIWAAGSLRQAGATTSRGRSPSRSALTTSLASPVNRYWPETKNRFFADAMARHRQRCQARCRHVVIPSRPGPAARRLHPQGRPPRTSRRHGHPHQGAAERGT